MSNDATCSYLGQDLSDFSEKINKAFNNVNLLMELYTEKISSAQMEIELERKRLGFLGRFLREFSFKSDDLVNLNSKHYWLDVDQRHYSRIKYTLEGQMAALAANPTYITVPNDFVSMVNKYSNEECVKIEQ